MIDLATENLLTLEQAAERLLMNKSTLFRWITKGTNGIRLEAIKLGTRWRTSEEALQRFGDRLTPNHDANPSTLPSIRTSSQRQRDQQRIEEELDEMLGVRKCESCRVVINRNNVVIPKSEKLWCPQCLIKRKSATFGQRIRTFRWASSLSQHGLSTRSGIRIDLIRAYEFDEKLPSEAHIGKLIEVLGKDIVYGMKGYSMEGSESTKL